MLGQAVTPAQVQHHPLSVPALQNTQEPLTLTRLSSGPAWWHREAHVALSATVPEPAAALGTPAHPGTGARLWGHTPTPLTAGTGKLCPAR